MPQFHELVAGDADGATRFERAVSDAKGRLGANGASVYVYPADEYKGFKLFLNDDASAGFAVKPDGDIVSVFGGGSQTGR